MVDYALEENLNQIAKEISDFVKQKLEEAEQLIEERKLKRHSGFAIQIADESLDLFFDKGSFMVDTDQWQGSQICY